MVYFDFSKEFKRKFLIKCGYTPKNIKCYKSFSSYHNDVDYIDKTIEVWTKYNKNIEENKEEYSYIEYTLEYVFKLALEEKLISLFD